MAHPSSEHTVDLEPWRATAQALSLSPSYQDGRLSWQGRPGGHDLAIEVSPDGADRAAVTVVVRSASLGDRLIVAPVALALSREGRFLTGDLELDRAVLVQGDRPDVAAPWDAETRASARRLVGELGLVVAGSAARLAPFGTATVTAAGKVAETVRAVLELVGRLATRDDVAEAIEAIASDDPSQAVRGMYQRVLADAAPTGALGEARAREMIHTLDAGAEEAFETLMRAATESPSSQIREDAMLKLLVNYPVARVEPLLLTTEDSLGVRVRDALIAAIHRAGPPVSPVALLRLMARTPMGPSGLRAAAEALGVAEDPASAARLAALCQHKEEQVSVTALTSLVRLRLTPDATLGWIEGSGRPELIDRVPGLVVATRPAQGGPLLLALLGRWAEAPAARRVAVIRALGRIGFAPARDALAQLASDPDGEVAAAAAEALGALTPADASGSSAAAPAANATDAKAQAATTDTGLQAITQAQVEDTEGPTATKGEEA